MRIELRPVAPLRKPWRAVALLLLGGGQRPTDNTEEGITTDALEICAGAGGEALGLENAGFSHVALNEIDPHACQTLRLNRPGWNVLETDVRELNGRDFRGISLLAGGVPCPPFSIAGKQRGHEDERDLFPEALRLIDEAKPEAVLLENVRGFATAKFDDYREDLMAQLRALGYVPEWKVLNAADYSVPQLRPRFVLVALKPRYAHRFKWPARTPHRHTVGSKLEDLMGGGGWPGTPDWVRRANGIAPTIVGGSKKHGGPDLGPTRARQQWAALGVDGLGIADGPPGPEVPEFADPRLTYRMAARLQGFPDTWQFSGRKTAAYRQVGNALPPPVAEVVGLAIKHALNGTRTQEESPRRRQWCGIAGLAIELVALTVLEQASRRRDDARADGSGQVITGVN